MSAVVSILASALSLAAEIARSVNNVIVAERVESILKDEFPAFYKRAKAKTADARRRLRG